MSLHHWLMTAGVALAGTAIIGCEAEEEAAPPPAPEVCVDNPAFFANEIWPRVIQTKCIGCHNPQGIGGRSDLVMQSNSVPGFMEHNFEVFSEVAELERRGTSIILLKPSAQVDHGGGLLITEDSPEYASLAAFVERVNAPVICEDTVVAPDENKGVQLLSPKSTLRKASLSLIGRLPTPAEYETIGRMGTGGVELVLSQMMEEEGFYDRLRTVFNDLLLTDRYFGGNNANNLVDTNDFPGGYWFDRQFSNEEVQEREIARRVGRGRARTNYAIAREPVELMVHVVRNNRPFTEVLTADYTVVTPFSARTFGLDIPEAFVDREEPNAYARDNWLEVQIPGVPHSGVLTTSAYLNRYPTTATNRNRHRAKKFYEYFLATDVLRLGERPIDDVGSSVHNPTLNDPQCTVCHTVIDPVAGAFQNWDDRGRYRPMEGGWYAGMLAPGLGELAISPEDTPSATRWLAYQAIEDPRFPLAITHLAYKIVTGEDPVRAPSDPDLPNAATQQAAFDYQEARFEELAQHFAGTGFNFKVLVRKMAMSAWFRAHGAKGEVGEREAFQLGTARLLSPEQLTRKVRATTGFDWYAYGRGGNSQLLTDYRMLYGGIDSNGVTKRLSQANGLMAAIGMRLANEHACYATGRDFSLRPAHRRLFPHVEAGYEPETTDGFAVPEVEQKIRTNLKHLYRQLLDEGLEDNSAEMQRVYSLFYDTWKEGKARVKDGQEVNYLHSHCRGEYDWVSAERLPVERRVIYDENYTLRAWRAVLTYLLSDYNFLHE
jgi:hypothetical protein